MYSTAAQSILIYTPTAYLHLSIAYVYPYIAYSCPIRRAVRTVPTPTYPYIHSTHSYTPSLLIPIGRTVRTAHTCMHSYIPSLLVPIGRTVRTVHTHIHSYIPCLLIPIGRTVQCSTANLEI